MTNPGFSTVVAIAVAGLLATGAHAAPKPPPSYTFVKSVPLGTPDRWDYVVFDGDSGRTYVAHSDKLAVIDAKAGVLIGQVEGIDGGTHGTGISFLTGQGFTDDGRNGMAVAFDLKTLKIIRSVPADKDADAIVADKATGHIFVIEGDPGAITVIDPKNDSVLATIKAGEKMEYGAADGLGAIFVAGNEKQDLLKIDARTNIIVARWPTPSCTSPHGLAYDASGERLFMGCVNSKLIVVDAKSGKVVTELAIGRGSDAIAFDAKRRRVFSSNGADGTITVYQQLSPNSYEPMGAVTTAISGRTMAVDPESGRLFVAAADTDPPATAGGRPRTKPGTLKLMIFDPVK